MNVYKQIKSIIPARAKFPLWYIFKAPQRKISPFSLFTDVWGILIYIWFRVFPKKNLKPISICTGTYNRSDNYLNRLVAGINKAAHRDLIELSVFDCHSTDTENLEESIKQLWKGQLAFTSEQMAFSRSATFNQAVDQATHSIIFICDADMSVPENIVELCNQYTGKKKVWYPIVYFLFKDKPDRIAKGNGVWEQYSAKGMLACLKKDFITIGKLDEQYTQWGAEDNDLWERFYREGFTVISNRQKGMIHHWHATHNKKYVHLNYLFTVSSRSCI